MKKYIALVTLFLAAVLFTTNVMAQGCSMCTATANQLSSSAASGLNMGIVYLAIIPLLLLGTLFYKWYKSNKNQTEVE